MKVARIYQRVSTDQQDLTRQDILVNQAKSEGYYIAGLYREHASGALAERPELQRLILDLQPGDVVIAEKMDRISRLPLKAAEDLIGSIRSKGARLSVPGVLDLSDFAAETDGVAKIVLEAVQELLLKLALQMAHDDYETRRERQRQGVELAKRIGGKYVGKPPNLELHDKIIRLRQNNSISETAKLLKCSQSLVKKVWRLHKAKNAINTDNGKSIS